MKNHILGFIWSEVTGKSEISISFASIIWIARASLLVTPSSSTTSAFSAPCSDRLYSLGAEDVTA